MFQDIHFSEDSWHRRLQVWTLDIPRLDNLCPYFWLTILCLCLLPIISILKMLRWVLNKITDILVFIISPLFASFDFATQFMFKIFDPDNAWRTQFYIRHMSDAAVYWYWKRIDDTCCFDYSERVKARKIIESWKSLFDDWQQRLNRIIAEQKDKELIRTKKYLDKYFAAQDRAVRRRRFFSKLAGMTQRVMKPIFWVLGACVLAFGLIGLGFALHFLFTEARLYLLIFIGTVVVIALIASLIMLLDHFKWFGLDRLLAKCYNGFEDWVLIPIFKFFIICLEPFDLFSKYVAAVLNDNCPAITWKKVP